MWRGNEWVEFDFIQKDSISRNDINIIVRHTPDFRYDRLLLEVRTINPEQIFWCDTISILLMDNEKQWLGQNHSTNYDLNTTYRRGVRFARNGEYNIRIRYLYPTDSLEGIDAIGLTIEKNGKE